jgi:transglutaminase-like putative cysteine protease
VPLPGWVELTAVGPSEIQDRPWRLVERQLLVHRDGSSTFVVRHVIDITDRSVLDEAAVLDISVRPSSETLTLHRAEVRRNGTWSDRLRSSRITDARRERRLDQATLDGRASHVVVLDDLRLGDRLEVIWSIRGRDPALLGGYSGGLRLDDGPSVARSVLRVVVEPGLGLAYRASGGVPAPTKLAGGDLVWDLTPPPAAVTLPEDLPGDAAMSVTPRVQLTSFGSWPEVATWAADLYRSSDPPAELREVAQQIASTQGHRDAQVLAALQWVQREIRYFAVHLDEHTLRPHGLEEILRRRYGDCKDQAALLVALLRELGVAAVPVLVDATTPGSAWGSLPSPAPFDHVTVMLLEDSSFLDPTLAPSPAASLDELWIPRYLVGLPALAGSDLVEIPGTSSFEGEVVATARYRIARDRSFTLEVVTTQSGRLATEQRELLQDGPEALAEQYLAWYAQPGLELTAEPLEVDDPGPGQPLTLRERYRATPTTSEAFRALPLELSSLLPVPADDRALALLLPLPRRHRERVEIETPRGWTFAPIDADVSNPWFRFRATSTTRSQGLDVDYELELVGHAVAVEDLAAYRRAVAEVAAALRIEAASSPWWKTDTWPWLVALALLLVLAGAFIRRR